MINVTKGDAVLVRDVLKCREGFVHVMAAMDDLIITADDARFIERFDGEGWNSSRTKRIVRTSKGGTPLAVVQRP